MRPSDNKTVTRNANRPGRGFTLAETVLSMALMTIVLGGTTSVVLIASHALPGAQNPGQALTDSSDLVGQIAGELAYATSVTQKSATAVTFTVADRGHGGAGPETIRYAWSGTSGDPLTRQYNGGTIVNVAEDVQEFDLSYVLQTSSSSSSSESLPDVEMPEELFLEQDSDNSGSESAYNLSGNDQCAEKFKPVLPADALSWRITRTQFIASPSGSIQGSLSVEVMNTNSGTGKPGSTEDGVLVLESNLIADNWNEVQFTNAGGLSPSEAYFIVFRRASGGGTVGLLKIGTGSLDSPQTTYWSNEGSWNEDPTTDIWLWVWGKVTVPDSNPPPSSQVLVSVGIKLRLGTDAGTRVESAAQLLNVPELPAA